MDMGQAKVEVKVGDWWPDDTFVGEIVRFTRQELGTWTEKPQSSGEYKITTYTIYRTPESEYRVYVERISRWVGEGNKAWLQPEIAAEDLRPEESPPCTRPIAKRLRSCFSPSSSRRWACLKSET
jgi:hypothetical protein